MKKSDFLNKLKIYINRTAEQRNPNITANAIYFITKQYPINIVGERTYTNILKEVKKHLTSNFDWRMVEVHSCFCKLNRLLKCF